MYFNSADEENKPLLRTSRILSRHLKGEEGKERRKERGKEEGEKGRGRRGGREERKKKEGGKREGGIKKRRGRNIKEGRKEGRKDGRMEGRKRGEIESHIFGKEIYAREFFPFDYIYSYNSYLEETNSLRPLSSLHIQRSSGTWSPWRSEVNLFGTSTQ